jgi:uncharacterized membrane protein
MNNVNARERSLARIESFSDSIFGFAITLLVLNLLEIPRVEMDRDLLRTFQLNWQYFFAFFVGFCTILVCWINHRHLFSYIKAYNETFLWINGALLLVITYIPFPTSLFSEFLLKENNTGLILFGLTYFIVSCISSLMWWYALKNNFVDDNTDPIYYRAIVLLFGFSIPYTLVALSLCFISSNVAIAMYALLFVVFAFPHHFALKFRKTFAEKRPS